ncbi:polysaccharide deacetylase family protein, PEP-CTERM locus subfamily [Marinobacter daqiaonensis]|uniref:Polysaccharide deacetylase family protein, PEP-CTERM locus subfamily n=1 Tax=Marinobacter daqiaonensis TaxID=650891 RepID=A0A1I6HX25_9GAMM|nr:XrtA system polysaccharide deacetylase [Marinobacter daqiaonensis]SFR58995.1 polysaccharide deacetylase family protein, PEP-CTERM locus subfamily [Marinobacter daqiaonensis]
MTETKQSQPAPYGKTLHALSIDVEDYFHVAALAGVISPDDWDSLPSRVERNTERLLELFERKQVKATFFVLGWVAERHPELIRKLADHGHEIASHGYSHQLIYHQTPAVFAEETRRSKMILEDIIQKPVTGYRAASYSITRESLWALDILAELGFTWDSSIFPIRHDRYGIPDSPKAPYTIQTSNGTSLREFPLTTAKLFRLTIPAAGGGYFRQFPYPVFRRLFRMASANDTRPQMFYLHPWEIDPDQPRYNDASWLSRFRHYTNLDKCYGRLERLLQDFRFGTVSQSYQEYQPDRIKLHQNEMIRLA